ncbi:hypothetical protein T484DRAFT_1758400, partial [Baffinella frigidus]
MTQPEIFNQTLYKENITSEIIEGININPKENSEINEKDFLEFTKIKEEIISKKLHTNPNLNLRILAINLDIKEKELSRIINTETSFYQLINSFRVAEFKKLIQSPKATQLSLLGLANDAGFSSKSTFYSTFKKLEDDSVINPKTVPTGIINSGTDPNFTIVANSDTGYTGFNRKVVVFGIPIYAVATVDDSKLLHAANLMAQYLDNNEDETVDNQAVLDAMLTNNAFMFMWKSESDQNTVSMPNNAEGQDLGNDETIPVWHTNGHLGQFDAALEEVWHIITHAGYASAYPSVFGEGAGSSLSNAMDTARGGNFTTIPSPYPNGSWYTYDDTTCEYD